MALSVPTQLDAVTGTASTTSTTSGSISPTGGALLVVKVGAVRGSNDPGEIAISDTLTGTGAWTVEQVLQEAGGHSIRVAVAWAVAGSTPGTGTITATWGVNGDATRRHLYTYEVTGQAATPVPAGQFATNAGVGTDLTVTLPSAPAADSMVFGAVDDNRDGGDITPGTGFTEATELQAGTGGSAYRMQAQYDLDSADASCEWTGLGGTQNAGAAIEIAAASGGGGDVTLTPAAATLTLTGQTPVVATTGDVTVLPTAGDLTLTGQTPTVTTTGDVTVSPAAASLTLTGQTPTVDDGSAPNLLETFQNDTASDVDITSRPSDSGDDWVNFLGGSAFVHPDDYGYVPSTNDTYHVFDTGVGTHDADIIFEGKWLSGAGVETYFVFLATDANNYMRLRLRVGGQIDLFSVSSGGLGLEIGSDFDYGSPALDQKLKIKLEIRDSDIFLFYDVDDGSGYAGFSGTPDHTWTHDRIGDGTHPGQLVGWGSDASSKFGMLSISAQPLVVPGEPIADFDHLVDGLDVQFLDRSSDTDPGVIAEWSWDWGDGTAVGTTENPTHTYATPGEYAVTLTVTDDESNTDDIERTVRVAARALDPFQELAGTSLAARAVLDGGHTWTVRTGTWEVNSRAASPTTAPAAPGNIATLDFGSEDGFIRTIAQSPAGEFGVIYRFDPVNGDFMVWKIDPVAGLAYPSYWDGGSWNDGATNAITAKSTDYHIEVELIDGGGATLYVDGAEIATSVSVLSGSHPHHGIWAEAADAVFGSVDISTFPVLDVFSVGGQSNARGRGSEASSPALLGGSAFEYDYSTLAIVILDDPVLGAGSGSYWPALGVEWIRRTGRRPFFVGGATGATGQSVLSESGAGFWEPGQAIYIEWVENTWTAIQAAQGAGYVVEHWGTVWDQGGRDAQAIDDAAMTVVDYRDAFLAMVAQNRLEFGPGYRLWMFRLGRPSISGDTAGWIAVREDGQDVVEASEADVRFVTTDAATIDAGEYIDDFHYGQPYLNSAGTEAAGVISDEEYGLEPGHIQPAAATLTLTGQTPTIQTTGSTTLTPASASLTLTGQTPTVDVTGHVTLEPAAASLTLTGQTPTVSTSGNVTVEPASATLSLTGQTPTVDATGHVTLEPAAASLTLTGHAPIVQTGDNVTVEPASASLSLTGQTPVVDLTGNIIVSPASGTLTLTGLVPTVDVTGSVWLMPASAVLSLTGQTPTVDTTGAIAGLTLTADLRPRLTLTGGLSPRLSLTADLEPS